MMVEFVSANPDRPAARGPRPAGRAGRRHLQPVRHPGLGRLPRVLLQRRGRADRHPGHQRAAARQGLQARRRRSGPRPPTTATTSPRSPPTSWPGKTVRSDDREFTASGDVEDLDGIRLFAVAYLRHEQDLDLKAFDVRFDNYYLESSLYTSGKVDAVGAAAARGGQDLRAGRRAVAQVHRVRRRQGPRHAQGRRQLHLLRARRGLPHHQVGARLRQGRQHPGHRPPRHHRAGARRPAGGRRRHPGRAIPTTCCTPWCA